MRTERLGDLGDAPAVLAAVADAGGKLGLGSPAALIGDWFGSRAVIAPQLRAAPVRRRDVFGLQATGVDGADRRRMDRLSVVPDAGVDGRGPRLPEAAGGWADCVLRQDRAGAWWYESLSGEAMPVVGGRRWHARGAGAAVPHRVGDADRNAHRAGCSRAWKRSRRARSTRRASAPSSPER